MSTGWFAKPDPSECRPAVSGNVCNARDSPRSPGTSLFLGKGWGGGEGGGFFGSERSEQRKLVRKLGP